MTVELKSLCSDVCEHEPVMIGIHTGGVWVAERLHEALGLNQPLGKLNISFYRDDFTRIGVHPQVSPSNLPFSVEDRCIILVDDVLYTGRTIRAALNEIYDYGRPARVILATLVDRGGRELPIQADVVGARMVLGAHEQVKLSGPEPLQLAVVTKPNSN
ncbi:MAG: bifunctional pyr operon transcriptional regulator/uracil phosphoribosyltransferase PyrR [Gammaproteobacteria bacterium]|nr:bifunctional pyr operon transcriptional regulator/uracil phosphoribosyltransferase PyrR [Gammaproteobacteria bacterium]